MQKENLFFFSFSSERTFGVAKGSQIIAEIRLWMMTQTKLAEMLGLSTARISEIITGKGEPSLKTGREISRKLNIDPAIVLGV